MNIVCSDMEGVIFPEIWIGVAEATGIEEFRITTREEPDYDKLMQFRLGIMKEHGLTINKVQEVLATIKPLPGAKEFLDELRQKTQLIIVSDTFTQFAQPLMRQLGMPTIFCHELEVAPSGEIVDYHLRQPGDKLSVVRALQSIGFNVIAWGDSYNDLDMIRGADAGVLFRTTEKIAAENPEIEAVTTYEELMAAYDKAAGRL